MNRKGFTLVELIVVIAIIAVLAAVVAPQAFRAVDRARVSGTIADVDGIKTASAAHFADVGAYPTSCATLAACQTSQFFNNTATNWEGPYLDKWPVGRWANSVVTYTSQTGTTFGTNNGERFVTITLVPAAQAQRIDVATDGTDSGTAGFSRYVVNGTTATMQILLNRDGGVS